MSVYKSIYFKSKSANEFECSNLGFYFINLRSTCFGVSGHLWETNNVQDSGSQPIWSHAPIWHF